MRYAEGEDITQGMDRVEAEADGDKGRRVVERGLHRVHVGPREGGGVVGLVVEAVNLETNFITTLVMQFSPVCRGTSRCQARWMSSTGAWRGA